MPTLDYETPSEKRRGSPAFWIGFGLAYLPGLFLLNMLDDFIHMRRFGRHNDGGVMILSLMASPAVVVVAGIVSSRWKRFRAIGYGAAFAIITPILFYLAWMALSV